MHKLICSTSLNYTEVGDIFRTLLHVQVKMVCVFIKMNYNCSDIKVNNGNIAEWLEESELCGQADLNCFQISIMSFTSSLQASYLI